MKDALEFLKAMEARWPAQAPRKHALTIAEDGRLSLQLGLELFYCFGLDAADMEKSSTQIIEEIAPYIEMERAKLKTKRSQCHDIPTSFLVRCRIRRWSQYPSGCYIRFCLPGSSRSMR